MPFRYGIVTLTELPHVFIRVRAEIDGQLVEGVAADHLPPKWFTKDPERDPLEEIKDMLQVIEQAMDFATEIEADSVFAWWWRLFKQQDAWGCQHHIETLLTHFGTSLLERALIDAFCRSRAQPFHQLLHDNAFGVDWSLCQAELAGTDWQKLLPQRPLAAATLRHTVGMVDVLTENQLTEATRLKDGLPQSLEACITHYGLKDFKLKLSGDADADLDRLRAIAAVIQRQAPDDYGFSLDANEQFNQPAELRSFGERVYADSALANFFEHILFIEQPLSRKVALQVEQSDVRNCWPQAVPILIDESDGGWDDLPRALALGYSGVSHKNCKGVFKGLRNLCLVQQHKVAQPGDRHWMTSAEDLCNIGPVALLQDLAVQAAFGNTSIERNGHHYFAGLSMFDKNISQALLLLHKDIYQADPSNNCRLYAKDGCIHLNSINQAPFGVKFVPDLIN